MSFLIILGKVGTVIVTIIGGIFGIGLVLMSILSKDHLNKTMKRRFGYRGRIFLFAFGFLMLTGVVYLCSIVF